MIPFLLIFFTAAGLFTTVSISLAEHKYIYRVGILLPGVICLLAYPLSIQLNNQSLQNLLNLGDIVTLVALIQIFESLLRMSLAAAHIRKHYSHRPGGWLSWIAAVPSLVFSAGLFFLLTAAFIHIQEVAFHWITAGLALVVCLLLWIGTLIFRLWAKSWAQRAEWLLITGLLQILLAMFLPLIVKGVKVPFSQIAIELMPMIFTLVIILAGALTGAVLRKYEISVTAIFKTLLTNTLTLKNQKK